MEKQDRREQARDGAIGSSLARHALILNPGSSHCTTNRCDSLGDCLRANLAFDHVHESNGSFLPATYSFVPDIILVRLPGDSPAQELITSCKEKWRHVSILALVCPAVERLTRETSSILRSVDDFLSCPFPNTELFIRIRRTLRSKPSSTASTSSGEPKERWQAMPIVGESPNFIRVIEKIPLLGACRDTVLISGETGSGKEVFSRAIHYQSPRHGKPFVPVNCGALPDHLFENELFGHVKGAFTDASSAEKGLIAEAEGGTIFLDEVDTLSQAGQIKLLRFLQDGEYRPVGSARSVIADVRILAGTNTDLLKQVEKKQFREDLYYRLNALSLSIPPLRERLEDVVPLTAHFLDRYAREHGHGTRVIATGAIDKLMSYRWPGNVRELESIITRAVTFTCAPTIQPEDIDLPSGPGDDSPSAISLREAKNKTVAAFERRYLASLLAQHQGNVTRAAKAAGKERRSFQRLLRKYDLNRNIFQS